jgi:hypothetical protein
MSTIAERQKAVEQMNANAAIEGFYPTAIDREMFARYIAGTTTIEDMREEAHRHAAEAAKGSLPR